MDGVVFYFTYSSPHTSARSRWLKNSENNSKFLMKYN